jgi:hypothetical protein
MSRNNPRPIKLDNQKIEDAVNQIIDGLQYSINILQGDAYGDRPLRDLPQTLSILAKGEIQAKRIGQKEDQQIKLYVGSDKSKHYNQGRFIKKAIPQAGFASSDNAIVFYVDADMTPNQLESRINHNHLQEELKENLMHELTHATEYSRKSTSKVREEQGYDAYLNDPFEIRASMQVMVAQLDNADEKTFRTIFNNLPFDYVVKHFSSEYRTIAPHLTKENESKLLSSAYQFFTEKGFNMIRTYKNPRPIQIDKEQAKLIVQDLFNKMMNTLADLHEEYGQTPLAQISTAPLLLAGGIIDSVPMVGSDKERFVKLQVYSAPNTFSHQNYVTKGGAFGLKNDNYGVLSIKINSKWTPISLYNLMNTNIGKSNPVFDQMYSVFIHEFSHARQFKKSFDERPQTKKIYDEQGYVEYLNSPSEMDAHMQQIIDELVFKYETKPSMIRVFFNSNPVDVALKMVSPEYRRIAPHLTEKNNMRMLSASVQALMENGFVFNRKALRNNPNSSQFQEWFNGGIFYTIQNGVKTPTIFYHETSNQHVQPLLEKGFDLNITVMSDVDYIMPIGVFLKTDDRYIRKATEHTNLALYTNVSNPIKFHERWEIESWLKRNMPKSWLDKLQKRNNLPKIYQSKIDDLEEQIDEISIIVWNKPNHPLNPKLEELEHQTDLVIKEWEQAEINISRAMREQITQVLIDMGYDSLLLEKDDNTNQFASNMVLTTLVVFDPHNVKSVNNVGNWSKSNKSLMRNNPKNKHIEPKERFRRFTWGIEPTMEIHIDDDRYPANLVAIGRLMELRLDMIDQNGNRANPAEQLWCEIDENSINDCFIFFDNDHHKDRIYFYLNEETQNDFADLYEQIDEEPVLLKDLAPLGGGHHGRMKDYPKVYAKPLGYLTDVVYFARKNGEEDEINGTGYIHKMGEEKGGTQPIVAIAQDGSIWLCGGSYTCPNAGITN